MVMIGESGTVVAMKLTIRRAAVEAFESERETVMVTIGTSGTADTLMFSDGHRVRGGPCMG